MKIYTVVPLLATMAALCAVSCGNPEQKIRLKVTDESGLPIKNAACTVGWWKDVFARDTTDAKGIVEFRGETAMTDTMVRATAPGYYKSEVISFLMDTSTAKPTTRWDPWPVELTFMMKKIIRPHPMYFYTDTDGDRIFMPPGELGQEYGYDLLVRDWVAPHGKGKIADFRISGHLKTPDDTEFTRKGWLVVRFSNANDGMIEFCGADSGGSLLQGPHEAPVGDYKPEVRFSNWLDDAKMKQVRSGKWSPPMFVFRVRTVADKDGKIVSSRYGKLAGGITGLLFIKRQAINMTYYLNGTDNDRGLEWDMKNNLFKDLEGKFANWGKP